MTRRTPQAADRRRDPARTKERILDAALHEFAAKGYAGARVGEIADRAGVNKQLISYYFGGKEGLHRAIVQNWSSAEADADTRRDELSLADVTTGYLARDDRTRSLARLLAWEGLAGAQSGEPGGADGAGDVGGGGDAGGAGDAGEAQRDRLARGVRFIADRQRAGELAADIDPACFLLAFMAAASAPATMPQLVRSILGTDPASDEFLDHYADQLTKMIGYLAQPSS